MDKRLRNKVALLTSAGGAGLAAAKRFAAEGAEVIVISRDARRELDGVANVVELDVADEASVAKLFRSLGRKHGRLDILFLNDCPVEGMGLALKHAIPILSEGASVIVDRSIVFRASRDSLFITGAELAAGGVA